MQNFVAFRDIASILHIEIIYPSLNFICIHLHACNFFVDTEEMLASYLLHLDLCGFLFTADLRSFRSDELTIFALYTI